jgi:polar amino acid transport system substrate-binding protein
MRLGPTTRALAVASALLLGLTACGTDDDSDDGDAATDEVDTGDTGVEDGEAADADDLDLVAAGTLTVCSDVPYPPFEYEDADAPSGYSGFDIDLVQAIADHLDLELEVVESGFDGLESGATLAAGQCDLAASAMTITEERAENLNFSEPYYEAEAQSLIVLADSGIESLEDLAGEAVGVQAATTGAAYAEENAPDDVEIQEFPSGPDIFTAMRAGQVGGGLQDLPVNRQQVEQDDDFEIVEEYDTEEEYGFAAAQGNDDLIATINQALAELQENGTYDQIFEEYFAAE